MSTTERHLPRERQIAEGGVSRPAIWAVVLNWRDPDATTECVQMLMRSGYENLSILIVDNGSGDQSEEILRNRFPECHFLQTGQNLGYAGGNGAGMLYCLEMGAFAVLVINPDCVVERGFLDPLVDELLEHEDTGATGPVQLNRQNSRLIWANGGSRFSPWNSRVIPDGPSAAMEPPRGGRYEVGFICGACILLRADAIREVGPFDPRLFLFSEEPDWCARARRRGWKTVTVAFSRVEHAGSTATSSTRRATTYYICRNACWVARRHGTVFQATINAIGALCWRAPRAFVSSLLDRELPIGLASLHGYFDGVFGDCRRGKVPEEAEYERVYELKDSASTNFHSSALVELQRRVISTH